jgi:hypothetical protein
MADWPDQQDRVVVVAVDFVVDFVVHSFWDYDEYKFKIFIRKSTERENGENNSTK